MKIPELKSIFSKSLEDMYPSEEIQSFFNILSEEYLSMSRLEIALNSEKEVSEEVFDQFQHAILRLKKNEPIQYIIGKTDFYGLPFKVNKHTLIPRPETEELVDWILTDEKLPLANDALSVLDIGTGSGCIAISLAKNLPNSKVHAVDISEGALNIARENAVLNQVDVEMFQMDVLNTKSLPITSEGVEAKKYDIIVSNPPYVRELERKLMQPNVVEYEPETALFVPDQDPLVFYRIISRLAKIHLKRGGVLFFEINESFKSELKELLKDEGFRKTETKQDIYGKDRMIRCAL